ncbi:hypothetical protein [Vibrio sp. DNB22_12_1]
MVSNIFKGIAIFVSVISLVVTIYVSYDIYHKETTKVLEIKELFTSNPSSSLSGIGDKLKLTINGEAVKNLHIVKFLLRNAGESAILPSDFHEKITVSVTEPWKVIGIVNDDSFPQNFDLMWNEVSDTTYAIEPILINPNDRISFSVYLSGESLEGDEGVPLVWKTRIENLSDIRVLKEDSLSIDLKNGLLVVLSGWSLPFTLLFFIAFLLFQLEASRRAKVIDLKSNALGVVVLFSLLSICAGEVLAYFIFQPVTGDVHWSTQIVNWLILVVQVLVVIWLSIRLMTNKNA